MIWGFGDWFDFAPLDEYCDSLGIETGEWWHHHPHFPCESKVKNILSHV